MVEEKSRDDGIGDLLAEYYGKYHAIHFFIFFIFLILSFFIYKCGSSLFKIMNQYIFSQHIFVSLIIVFIELYLISFIIFWFLFAGLSTISQAFHKDLNLISMCIIFSVITTFYLIFALILDYSFLFNILSDFILGLIFLGSLFLWTNLKSSFSRSKFESRAHKNLLQYTLFATILLLLILKYKSLVISIIG